MSILKQKQLFFNCTNQHVPKQLHRLFSFGCQTLTTRRVGSVRGNARTVESNYHTAKTKAYRLLANPRWLKIFPQLLSQLGLIGERSIVALDFSAFDHWQVLTFAVQTRLGRAIPVYFEIIRYPITENSQNIFVCEASERLVEAIGCRPKLVMDRGFACPHIIEHLAQRSHPFIVRIKACKTLRREEKKLIFKAQHSPENDLPVHVYEHDLRLVVSDNPGNGNQPWYLITNDVVSVRDGIVADYYHRFEIEEFFKDAKWLQGLEHCRFQKRQSIIIVLWFVTLGWWFMAKLERDTLVVQGKHSHDRLSFPRLVMEALSREQNQLVASWLAEGGGMFSSVFVREKV